MSQTKNHCPLGGDSRNCEICAYYPEYKWEDDIQECNWQEPTKEGVPKGRVNKMMKCTVCGCSKEVSKLSSIYTIGSEGTDLCLDCRIAVSKFIRSMMDLSNRVTYRTIKEIK